TLSMNPHELIVLTSYRWPAQSPLMIGGDEAAALLNAYSVLWHPAALQGAAGPPRLASPYDYEEPVAGHVYALPESPSLMLPEDWDQRARDAGALAFRASANRKSTLENLHEALKSRSETGHFEAALLEVGHERAASFFSIGFGYLVVET